MALVGSALIGAPAFAQSSPQQDIDTAARLAQEAVQRLLRALQGAIDYLPQYQAPEVLPNGDIIIRRVPPKRAPEQRPSAPPPPKPGPRGDDVKT